MSRWAKLGVAITDLECLKQSARKHDLTWEDARQGATWGGSAVIATLKDNHSYQSANVVLDKEKGVYRIAMDVDANYSPLAKRIGPDGGKMARDYAVLVVKKNASRMGGFITSQKEMADGSIVIQIGKAE